jgi:tetratricopeptide (TPR) repeat protein
VSALATAPLESIEGGSRGAFQRALTEYREAQAASAGRPEGPLNLALLDARAGSFADAERELLRAIWLGPEFVPAYVNLADLYRAQGRDDEGERFLRKAIRIAPESAEAHHALGLLLVRRKHTDVALQELERAAILAPDDPHYSYVYAVGLHSSGQTERALGVLRRTHEQHPGDRDVLVALVTINRDRGDLASAVSYAERLVAIAPDDPATRRLRDELDAARAQATK